MRTAARGADRASEQAPSTKELHFPAQTAVHRARAVNHSGANQILRFTPLLLAFACPSSTSSSIMCPADDDFEHEDEALVPQATGATLVGQEQKQLHMKREPVLQFCVSEGEWFSTNLFTSSFLV